MSLVRFEIFSAVVDLGSFTKAAQKLNVTQSAVSHAISGLESEWGTTLLIRDRKKGLMLTDIGRKTLIHMREILNQMEKIKQEVAFASNLEAGVIRIGSFASATSCLLPKIISKFHKKYPNIEFTFFEGTYDEIMEWFETGVVDIGIVVQQNNNPNLHVLPLIEDKMVVAFPEGHRFEHHAVIDVQELIEEDFIMPKGIYRPHVDDIFAQAGLTPNVRFEVQDCNTLTSMVQEGLGITIGPELLLMDQSKIKTGNLKQVSYRSVALAYPSFAPVSPAVDAFLAVARDIFTEQHE